MFGWKKWVCDSGIRITWVQVSRLLVLHPDKDRWKHHHGWILVGCLGPITILWKKKDNNNNNDDIGSKNNKIRFRSQNYMGASFQAPHAAPGQRQMEMHHDSLIIVLYFSMPLQQDHLGMYINYNI